MKNKKIAMGIGFLVLIISFVFLAFAMVYHQWYTTIEQDQKDKIASIWTISILIGLILVIKNVKTTPSKQE